MDGGCICKSEELPAVLIGIGVAIGVAAGVAVALLAVQLFGATGVGKARRLRASGAS